MTDLQKGPDGIWRSLCCGLFTVSFKSDFPPPEVTKVLIKQCAFSLSGYRKDRLLFSHPKFSLTPPSILQLVRILSLHT